ncbi:hypothetical protein ACFRAE_08695 [Sphingobacterium sp. HJSM2_6]|uniref:hypothetical protein n=1 Tax=Sphingobacterium sp. HJSM2_6 TaxID=3366264 RepID=UPI003BD81CE5
MKKIFTLLLIVLTLSCSKEGGPGPQGDQGIPGKDGTNILSGASNPTSTIGKEGDFFLNVHSKILFGPKKGNNWGSGIVLSGSAGSSSNTILNGKGAPAAGNGSIGDFYIDTENFNIYGAKVSTGWGTPVNLKSDANEEIRILIKEGIRLNIIDNEINFNEYDPSENLSSISTGDTDIKITVGNIQKYLDEGVVIIQIKSNLTPWSLNEVDISNGDFYYYADVENDVKFDNNTFTFPKNGAGIDKTNLSKQNALAALKSEVNKYTLTYKFLLIPASSVEKLSKAHPNQKIDSKLLSTFYYNQF